MGFYFKKGEQQFFSTKEKLNIGIFYKLKGSIYESRTSLYSESSLFDSYADRDVLLLWETDLPP